MTGLPDSWFRRIVETTNAGIWVMDPEGQLTFANATVSDVFGYTAEEMLSLSLFDLLDEQGRAQAAANLERRRQGHHAQLECAFLAKDGSQVWVLLNASPLHDDHGDYAGAVCILSEITDRKEIEDALQQREQQLAEAQRVGRLGSWEWDVVADRTSWSDEMYRLFGLTPEELEPTYEGYLAHVHPDDRPFANARVTAALEGDDAFEYDARTVGRDGQIRWVRARGQVVRDEVGAPVLMRGTALDVTDSKQAQQDLEETAARYRLLQTMASAANEASSLHDILQTAVREICAHTGWPVGHVHLPDDDAEVLLPSDIWHCDDPERFQVLREATMASSFRSGEGVVGRQLTTRAAPTCIRDVTLDPEHPWAAATSELGVKGHVLFTARIVDEPVAVVEFFSPEVIDVDHAVLDTLEEVGKQLGRVAERERADAALAAARDAAMEASRLKSEFVATMSHEIRTPMNGVIGLTGLLLETDLDERQRQYAEGVERAGEALLTVINDILDFSKIEAGKLDLEQVDFDLVEVVEASGDLVADSARRKGLELVAYCYPDVPAALRGDPGRLRQVLVNLASNAVKFTDEGEVVVRARLVDETEDTVVVRFEVIDSGIGISEAEQEQLFRAFSQADASTTRRFGGTGLGLAISDQLVAALGGELQVDSRPGEGSMVWFTLPFRRAADGAVVPSRAFEHLLHGVRVLVVDDNETNRMILGEQLAAWDMEADLTPDGPTALEHLRDTAREGRPYEVAVLDMCMEEMDGLELARRISADPDLRTTGLILLTSTAEVDPDEVTRAGVAAHQLKPVRLSELYDSLMRLTAPVVRTADQEPAPAAPVARDRGRVLVVEDQSTNQMVALGILDQLGYAGDIAANGLEALQAMEESEYAAVLMDCQMPEMDGYTATAEIRRRPGPSRDIPVIAMTAGASEEERERCLVAGMDDYIAKPVTPQDIDEVLTRWVGDREHPGAEAVIDPERLETLQQMGTPEGALLTSMVEVFVAETPTAIATLTDAASEGDLSSLHREAHRLRGAAANLGATTLAERCGELEALEAPAGAPDLVRSIRDEFDQASIALRGTVGPGSP